MTKRTQKKNIKRMVGTVLPSDYPTKLEHYMWPEGIPKWMPRYKDSPELMTIFYLLFSYGYNSEVNTMDGFENAAQSYGTFEDRLRHIIGAETRKIISFKCHTDFTLKGCEHTPLGEIPLFQTVSKAREIKKGDILLVRIDKKDLDTRGFVELHILTNGLFNSEEDDFRCFTGTMVDISQIYSYAKKEANVLLERSNQNDKSRSNKKRS